MTIEEAWASDKVYLTPAEVGSILNMNPQSIRDAARYRPDLLGFQTIVTGTRTRIPKVPFLEFLGGKRNES